MSSLDQVVRLDQLCQVYLEKTATMYIDAMEPPLEFHVARWSISVTGRDILNLRLCEIPSA